VLLTFASFFHDRGWHHRKLPRALSEYDSWINARHTSRDGQSGTRIGQCAPIQLRGRKAHVSCETLVLIDRP